MFSNRGDLATFALTYPDAATNYREFSNPELEAFLLDTLTNWGRDNHLYDTADSG